MENNIVLIGMMGSGKTTTGKALAAMKGADFLDLDEVIVSREGKSIPEIFSKFGEEHFRALESKTITSLNCKNTVISTGGGVVNRKENLALLRNLGKVFYLKAPAKILYERITGDKNRPLLKSEEEFAKILAGRESAYLQADFIIDATKNIDEIVKEICTILQN